MSQLTPVAVTFMAAHVASAKANKGVTQGSSAQQCRQHRIKPSRPPGRGAAPRHKVCPLPGLPRSQPVHVGNRGVAARVFTSA